MLGDGNNCSANQNPISEKSTGHGIEKLEMEKVLRKLASNRLASMIDDFLLKCIPVDCVIYNHLTIS